VYLRVGYYATNARPIGRKTLSTIGPWDQISRAEKLALLSGCSLFASLLSLVLVVPAGATTSVPSPTAGGGTLLGKAAVVSSASPANLQLTDASSTAMRPAWPTTDGGARCWCDGHVRRVVEERDGC